LTEGNGTEQCTEVYPLHAVHNYESPGIIYWCDWSCLADQ